MQNCRDFYSCIFVEGHDAAINLQKSMKIKEVKTNPKNKNKIV
jgi:hypothetical protein